MLNPFLNRKIDLFVRNGVLRYKQLIRPMMDYKCHAWMSASCTHVPRLRVLQSKCLRLATSNRQIYEDLGVPLFAVHIRALTASFDSKIADVGSPLVQQVGRYSDRWLTLPPPAKVKDGRDQLAIRGHRP